MDHLIFHQVLIYKQHKTVGVFQQDLLTSVLSQGFTAEFSPDDFLKLMEDVSIIAALPQEEKYLVFFKLQLSLTP